MRPQLKTVLIALAAILLAGTCVAGETLIDQGKKMGRVYHSDLYESGSCDACHDQKGRFPSDFSCTACHDQEALIEATARPEDEQWQNPHNNMHYGQDVPCMECHGEHQEREHLCAGCHSFEYPDFEE